MAVGVLVFVYLAIAMLAALRNDILATHAPTMEGALLVHLLKLTHRLYLLLYSTSLDSNILALNRVSYRLNWIFNRILPCHADLSNLTRSRK